MTVRDDAMIEVQNLADHMVVYSSFEGRRRAFEPQQKMKISAEELRQLAYSRGGLVLIKDYLSIKNNELAIELGVSEDSLENEYQWTKKDVVNLLNNGSLDALKDALDFAPAAIVDMIVDEAVNMKINDVAKRKAITDATSKNIDIMIARVEDSQVDTPETAAPAKKTRRVSSTKKESTGRRVQE